jgi:polyferredoxin
MGLLGRFSPTRIRRNADACIDCGKCSQACGSRIPVDQLVTVRSAECTGCLRCVAACPSRDALAMTVLRRPVTPAWIATGIAVIFLGLVLAARLTGHWHTDLPEQIYFELVPAAQRFSHP